MEEDEQLQALMVEQDSLLKQLKALLQRVKALMVSLEQYQKEQPLCMGSSCCRHLDDPSSHRP
jgi:hypothetical protein